MSYLVKFDFHSVIFVNSALAKGHHGVLNLTMIMFSCLVGSSERAITAGQRTVKVSL